MNGADTRRNLTKKTTHCVGHPSPSGRPQSLFPGAAQPQGHPPPATKRMASEQRMYVAALHVPAHFVGTCSAYRQSVKTAGLSSSVDLLTQESIKTTRTKIRPTRPYQIISLLPHKAKMGGNNTSSKRCDRRRSFSPPPPFPVARH